MKHYSNTHSGTKHLELDFIPFILSDIKILLFKHIAPSILLPLFFSLALYTHGAHIFCAPRLIKKHGRIKRRVGKKKRAGNNDNVRASNAFESASSKL